MKVNILALAKSLYQIRFGNTPWSMVDPDIKANFIKQARKLAVELSKIIKEGN